MNKYLTAEYVTNSSNIFLCIVLVLLLVPGLLKKRQNLFAWRNKDHLLDQESVIVEVGGELPRRVMAVPPFQSTSCLWRSSCQAGLETAFPEHPSLRRSVLCLHLFAHSFAEPYALLPFFSEPWFTTNIQSLFARRQLYWFAEYFSSTLSNILTANSSQIVRAWVHEEH